tara:strand:- start:1302 stop:2294 length:993 start_codon:yes stop_codon:yes gene_type:complete
MNKEWDFLLCKFRSLGGIAENVCQQEGKLGRGIFSINPNLRSRIFTPSQLMIKQKDICLEDNHLRIKKDKDYSHEIRNFFNYYQDNFSWGRGGEKTTESFEKGLSRLPSDVKKLIKNNFLVDLEERHKGDWKNVLKNQFLNARSFKFGQDVWVVPILELVNHEVNAFPFIKNNNGISTPNYNPRESELTYVYGSSSSIKRVFNYGFFCQDPIVFSLPFSLKFKDSKSTFICKGRDLKDDKIEYQSNDSQVVIDGIPIASINQPSVIKNYFEHLCDLINLQKFSQEIFSRIIRYNYLTRQEIVSRLKPLDNDACRILCKAINYELDSISQV